MRYTNFLLSTVFLCSNACGNYMGNQLLKEETKVLIANAISEANELEEVYVKDAINILIGNISKTEVDNWHDDSEELGELKISLEIIRTKPNLEKYKQSLANFKKEFLSQAISKNSELKTKHKSESEIVHDNGIVHLNVEILEDLPFGYLSVGDSPKAFKYLPERCWTKIDRTQLKEEECLLVGPNCPCIAIIASRGSESFFGHIPFLIDGDTWGNLFKNLPHNEEDGAAIIYTAYAPNVVDICVEGFTEPQFRSMHGAIFKMVGNEMRNKGYKVDGHYIDMTGKPKLIENLYKYILIEIRRNGVSLKNYYPSKTGEPIMHHLEEGNMIEMFKGDNDKVASDTTTLQEVDFLGMVKINN